MPLFKTPFSSLINTYFDAETDSHQAAEQHPPVHLDFHRIGSTPAVSGSATVDARTPHTAALTAAIAVCFEVAASVS
jgi:hypothetical protein